MTPNVNEHTIREFAYQIWESEGRPHGHSERHWDMACKLAAAQQDVTAPEGNTQLSANTFDASNVQAGSVTSQDETGPGVQPEVPPPVGVEAGRTDAPPSNDTDSSATRGYGANPPIDPLDNKPDRSKSDKSKSEKKSKGKSKDLTQPDEVQLASIGKETGKDSVKSGKSKKSKNDSISA